MQDVVTEWRGALAAEVCWVGDDRHEDRPDGGPATPLVLDGTPCLALPYSTQATVQSLASAPEVAFMVTDARSLASGSAVAAFGSVTVTHDLDGTTFAERLLDQELAKYPPSRTLSDSPLLRRENWWWLPRLIVRLDRVDRTACLATRDDPATDALLVRDGTGLRVDTVRARDWATDRIQVTPLDGEPLRGDGAQVLVLSHDYSAPDLERWEPWIVRGKLFGNELSVDERLGQPGAPLPPLPLLERVRRQRHLAKACRREIRATERSGRD